MQVVQKNTTTQFFMLTSLSIVQVICVPIYILVMCWSDAQKLKIVKNYLKFISHEMLQLFVDTQMGNRTDQIEKEVRSISYRCKK